MANFDEGKALRQLMLGKKVERAAAACLAATTPFFNIIGGDVLLTGLRGKITVAATANACSWVANPTVGTATQVLCAALDINPALVGDSLTITGLAGDAMVYGTAAGLGTMGRNIILLTGTLDFIAAAAVGSTSWTLFYVPIDDGAYVTAT